MASSNEENVEDDPEKLVNAVVDQVKSGGLFDQFRKECLEELENLDAYRMLKQRIENHVASFLFKFRWSEKMSKNNLRDNLRANINRSEVLMNGIDRLIDQILSSKSGSFSQRIGEVVNTHLGIDEKKHDELETDANITSNEGQNPSIVSAEETINTSSMLLKALPHNEDSPAAASHHKEDWSVAALPRNEDSYAVALTRNEDWSPAALPRNEDTYAATLTRNEDSSAAALPRNADSSASALHRNEDSSADALPHNEDSSVIALPPNEDSSSTALPHNEDLSAATFPRNCAAVSCCDPAIQLTDVKNNTSNPNNELAAVNTIPNFSVDENKAVVEKVECVVSQEISHTIEQTLKSEVDYELSAPVQANEGLLVTVYDKSNLDTKDSKCDIPETADKYSLALKQPQCVCKIDNEISKQDEEVSSVTKEYGTSFDCSERQEVTLEGSDTDLVKDENVPSDFRYIQNLKVANKYVDIVEQALPGTHVKDDEADQHTDSELHNEDVIDHICQSTCDDSNKNIKSEDSGNGVACNIKSCSERQIIQTRRSTRLNSDPENYAIKDNHTAKIRTRRSVSQDGTDPPVDGNNQDAILSNFRQLNQHRIDSHERISTYSESDTDRDSRNPSNDNTRDSDTDDDEDGDEVFSGEEGISFKKMSSVINKKIVEQPSLENTEIAEYSSGTETKEADAMKDYETPVVEISVEADQLHVAFITPKSTQSISASDNPEKLLEPDLTFQISSFESQAESSESDAIPPRRSKRGRKRKNFFDSEGSEADNTNEGKMKMLKECKVELVSPDKDIKDDDEEGPRAKPESIDRRGRRRKREEIDVNENVEKKTRKRSAAESITDNQGEQETVISSRPRRQIRPKRCYSPSEGK